MTFDEYFTSIAEVVSTKSKDPSTRVGAVVVGEDKPILSTGWNGFPRGVQDLPERMERPQKYQYTVHAEANAIANAARSGTRLKGSTIWTTHYPCSSCAGLIIQSGISEVVFMAGQTVGDHGQKTASEMFDEAKIKVRYT